MNVNRLIISSVPMDIFFLSFHGQRRNPTSTSENVILPHPNPNSYPNSNANPRFQKRLEL